LKYVNILTLALVLALPGSAVTAQTSTSTAPAGTTTATVSEPVNNTGNGGYWGLLGLIGLAGLAPLFRRTTAVSPPTTTATRH
jgi:hypothetical protein